LILKIPTRSSISHDSKNSYGNEHGEFGIESLPETNVAAQKLEAVTEIALLLQQFYPLIS
jgi:hypothetical protein